MSNPAPGATGVRACTVTGTARSPRAIKPTAPIMLDGAVDRPYGASRFPFPPNLAMIAARGSSQGSSVEARMSDRLIFQLGTNNWQRGGEFAPGSGILHEAHHHAYNALPRVRAYAMYPSRRQRFRDEDLRGFALEHDIPICESISPVSNYRWHSMSEDEVNAYRQRLTNEVAEWLDEIEANSEDRFSLAIAHHGFMNTVVMRDVIRRRATAGRDSMPLLCFVHGTELKMYANERRADQPAEFPLRFLPFMQREKIFDYNAPQHAVDVVASISAEQIETLLDLFPEFPRERVVLSQNGYNQDVFHRLTNPTDLYADRAKVLAGFMTQVPEGSGRH